MPIVRNFEPRPAIEVPASLKDEFDDPYRRMWPVVDVRHSTEIAVVLATGMESAQRIAHALCVLEQLERNGIVTMSAPGL